MNPFEHLLEGGDLRSIGRSNEVAALIDDQAKFDALFELLFHPDRKVVMRAADALEKVTQTQPGFLQSHREHILDLCFSASAIELKWHLALLAARIDPDEAELERLWPLLLGWAADPKESRIVRVNALETLNGWKNREARFERAFAQLVTGLQQEAAPSLVARLRKLGAAPVPRP